MYVRLGAKLVKNFNFCTMKVIDFVRLCGDLLKRLHDCGIRIDDYSHLKLYEDYIRMKESGNKTTYIVAFLSHKYGICERKIYKIIKHMESDCQNCAT